MSRNVSNNFIKTKLNRVVYRTTLVCALGQRAGKRRRVINQREYRLLEFLLQETEPTDPFAEEPSRKVGFCALIQAPYVTGVYRTVTRDTLGAPDAAGRLQLPDDARVKVVDARSEQVLHVPPPAETLLARMDAMVRFAEEGLGDGSFLHPVVQAIVLHFWLACDHPFEDGNGRTARALFYWSMLRRGYWMVEFMSISRFLKDAPAQYAWAFLHTETDGNDLTYFIVHQIDVILRALDALDEYVRTKTEQVRQVERMLRRSSNLNHRQLALLAHALRHPGAEYTTRSHRTSHAVAYATARADLFRLAELEWLERRRVGRRDNVFRAPPDLAARIRRR